MYSFHGDYLAWLSTVTRLCFNPHLRIIFLDFPYPVGANKNHFSVKYQEQAIPKYDYERIKTPPKIMEENFIGSQCRIRSKISQA
jgi:hypothetical protein